MRCARMLWFGGLLVLVVAPLLWSAGMVHGGAIRHWSQARWDSAGLAPDPATTPRSRGSGLRRPRLGLEGRARRAQLDHPQARRCGRVRALRGGGLGRAARRPGDPQGHARRRRLLGRQPAAGGRRAPRARGRAADRSDRGGDRELSLSRPVPHLARSQLQHLHRPHRARGAGARAEHAADGGRQGLSQRRRPARTHAERQRVSGVGARRARPRRWVGPKAWS